MCITAISSQSTEWLDLSSSIYVISNLSTLHSLRVAKIREYEKKSYEQRENELKYYWFTQIGRTPVTIICIFRGAITV